MATRGRPRKEPFKDTIDRIANSKPLQRPKLDRATNQAWKEFKKGIKNGDTVNNGFAEAIGFPGTSPFGFGFPQNQGALGTAPVESVNTSFRNLRWYLISNFRQFLCQLFVEIGLVQTIVDVPVADALRGGFDIKSKQLSEDQIEQLQISMDRDDDLTVIGDAARWNRLFGGAGILTLTDQDPEEPLIITNIQKDTPLEFRAVDLWELFWDVQNTEGYDPAIQVHDFEYYSYYGEHVHKSRVMRLKGITAPSFLRPRLRGWGVSVVETLVRSLNQYLKGTEVIFEVLDEFKLDIFKIKNLTTSLMNPQAQQKITQRIQMANWQKNYQNAMIMDGEDDYLQKQLSFAGIAETMQGIRMQVAADMRMPMIKLFGTTASGLNANDESSIEVYNSMVEGQVRNKIKYDILRMLEIKCQKLFGFIPDDMSIEFKPLKVLSAEQEENVKTQKYARIQAAYTSGLLSELEFRDACNKGNLFDIILDTDASMLNPNDGDAAKEGVQDPNDPGSDTNDPGADRADTRQVRAWDDGGAPKGLQKKIQLVPGAQKVPGSDDNAHIKNEEIKPYTQIQRINRVLQNSSAFDKASYEAEGGDSMMSPGREALFEDPGNVDQALWTQAKQASIKALGEIRPGFVKWWYSKMGGR